MKMYLVVQNRPNSRYPVCFIRADNKFRIVAFKNARKYRITTWLNSHFAKQIGVGLFYLFELFNNYLRDIYF